MRAVPDASVHSFCTCRLTSQVEPKTVPHAGYRIVWPQAIIADETVHGATATSASKGA